MLSFLVPQSGPRVVVKHPFQMAFHFIAHINGGGPEPLKLTNGWSSSSSLPGASFRFVRAFDDLRRLASQRTTHWERCHCFHPWGDPSWLAREGRHKTMAYYAMFKGEIWEKSSTQKWSAKRCDRCQEGNMTLEKTTIWRCSSDSTVCKSGDFPFPC